MNSRTFARSGDDSESEQTAAGEGKKVPATEAKAGNLHFPAAIETEDQALRDLSAFPIYFASSYSLVKPYVSGFDSNVLDAPSLKNVKINNNWSPNAATPAAR